MGQCNGIYPPDYKTNITELRSGDINVGAGDLDEYIAFAKRKAYGLSYNDPTYRNCVEAIGSEMGAKGYWKNSKTYDEINGGAQWIADACNPNAKHLDVG